MSEKDNTTGTAEVDDFEDKDPDDCYCESAFTIGRDTCISYAMGVDESIMELQPQGFGIEEDDGDYFVTFEYDKHEIWEAYIESHMKDTYWNEYILLSTRDTVFIIKENGQITKVLNHDFENDESLLETCNRLCEGNFKTIWDLIMSNDFYREYINHTPSVIYSADYVEGYRVTYKGTGIYEAAKHVMTSDQWNVFIKSMACTWLPKPPTYDEYCTSYFTEEGYKKFGELTIPTIIRYIDHTKIYVEKVVVPKSDIIYSDEYQFVTKNISTQESYTPCPYFQEYTSSNGIDLDLLTSPKTIELCKKYRNHGLPWFYYNAETRKEFGELPANIVDNYFKLIGILLTKNEIDYNTYKKYLDVLYKMHDIPPEACIKSTETIRNTSFSDGKKDSILKFGVSDGKLPYSDNVRLFHTSSTPNLTSLNPRFRSRKPGERIEALFPSPRVYFGYNAICSRLGGSIPIESVNEDYFKKSTDHLYEYVGPEDYISAIYKDPELRGGNAVYVETTHDLPVKEIKSFEEFKKGMISVNESYIPLSEFDHFFQEAKLKSKARKELDDSDFALVYKDASGNKIRKYPINDEAHVKAAARMFPRGVPNKYRKEVAGKILRRAHKFGIDTEGWKSLNNAANKD